MKKSSTGSVSTEMHTDRMGENTKQSAKRMASSSSGAQSQRIRSNIPVFDRCRLSLEDFMHGVQQDSQRALHNVSAMQDEMDLKDKELQQIKQRNQYLKTELNECRTQIIKSISTSNISDATVKQEYSLFRENLSNWVEGFPEIEDFASVLKTSQLAIRGWPAMFPAGPEAAQSEVLAAFASTYMHINVFDVMVFGAYKSEIQLLGYLYGGMHLLQPEKDANAINLWKSDTLRAYVSSEQYQARFPQFCKEIAIDLCEKLCNFKFKDAVYWEHTYSRFLEQIVTPAADLGIKMSCSPDSYRWEWYISSDWYSAGTVSKNDLERFTILDAETHQKIRTSKSNNLASNAKIGDLLVVIYPALFRCGKEGQSELQIEKAVILIRTVKQPLVKNEACIAGYKDTAGAWLKNRFSQNNRSEPSSK